MGSEKRPDFTPPRGMRDIMPEEMAKRKYVCGKIEEVLALFGYNLVDPSHIEKMETIFGKAGPGIEEEIYSFKDKGGRHLGLRFELTLGMARMVATKPDWPKPLRIAAISNAWRYDEPQYGRYRSFYQWDIELFGSDSPGADAEIVEVSCRIMDRLGLADYEMVVNDRNIVDAFLKSLDLQADKAQILRIMDKKGKITEDEMAEQLGALSLTDSQIKQIFGFASKKGHIFEICEFLREQPAMKNSDDVTRVEEIGRILEKSVGLQRIRFDLSLVRGLDYYTGFVFECYDPENINLGSVLGGGRFDGLVGIYGRDCPAVGSAGGIERLILSLESKDLFPKEIIHVPKVLIAPVTERELPEAMGISSRLREAGISAVVEVMGRKLGKSLETANKIGCEYTVIVGSRDLKDGVVTIRDMENGKEQRVSIEDVAKPIITGRS